MATPAELTERGRDASNAGRHAEAEVLLRRALRRSDEPDQRARAMQTLAHVLAERGHSRSGIGLCQEALALDGISGETRGLIHSQLALLQMRTGIPIAALASFERAVPFLEGDPESLARLYLNRGILREGQQDYDGAIGDFDRARALTSDPIRAARASHNLGCTLALRGDLLPAFQLMDEAAAVLAPLSPVSRAVCHSDKARVLAAAGMPAAAAELLADSAQIFGRRHLRQFQGEALFERAQLLLLTDAAAAGVDARKASRLFRARGSEGWALRADAVGYAATVRQRLIRTGRPPAAAWAQSMVDKADALATELTGSHLRAERVSVLMHAALATARSSATDLQVSVPQVPRGAEEPMTTRLLRHEVRALRGFRTGRRAAAYREIGDGLAELHAWQSTYGSLDLQSSLVGHGRGLARLGLEQAVADGRPEVLFEWSERARALVSRVPSVHPPADPETMARLAELRRLEDVSARRPLQQEIRQQAWFRAGAGEVLEPLGLGEVQERLGDAVLISHVIAGGRLVALVVSADGAEVVPLGPRRALTDQLPAIRADLDMTASMLPEAFRDVVERDLGDKLARAAATLVQPLTAYVEGRRVVLVPSARLAGVPWTLLPGLRGQPLTVARSASEWARQRPWSRPERAGFVPGPRVERAVDEVSACSLQWGTTARVLPVDAESEAMAELATTVDVLHVAAHGRHQVENPLFSEIELAGGPWFGYDVEALPRVPDVVVLSACDLGGSTVRWAEEQVGMAAAWMHAGARSVIASPSALNDQLACTVQPAFHAALVAGTPPAEALAGLAELGDLPLVCFGSGW